MKKDRDPKEVQRFYLIELVNFLASAPRSSLKSLLDRETKKINNKIFLLYKKQMLY